MTPLYMVNYITVSYITKCGGVSTLFCLPEKCGHVLAGRGEDDEGQHPLDGPGRDEFLATGSQVHSGHAADAEQDAQ